MSQMSYQRLFPDLFKKTSTGKIQHWKIYVSDHHYRPYPQIVTVYGQLDGKYQTTTDEIQEGKNIGKSNETTPWEQAEAEAQSRWEKQVKKGYVESLEDAKAGIDKVQGFKPMLAHDYEKHGHKIEFPCVVQPKLDGVRCCAVIQEGNVKLFTRTGRRINSLPHIEEQLSFAFPDGTYYVDGELYNHAYKDNFEYLVSIIRKDEPDPEHGLVQYHMYDYVSNESFDLRYHRLKKALYEILEEDHELDVVDSIWVYSEEEAKSYFESWVASGYEGGILRNVEAPYEHKRSYNLQKMKTFLDEEFPITGVVEGRGKLKAHAASFTCVTPKGHEFEAKLKGSQERLKEYFENPDSVIGKQLTVRFQGYTQKNNVPRFPVGIEIRDYE